MPTELPTDIFVRRLRAERDSCGITQSELARRVSGILGVKLDATVITRIEQRTRAVRLDEAVALARALDLTLATMLAEESTGGVEAEITARTVRLAQAQREWSIKGEEVMRLMRDVHALRGAPIPGRH